MNDKNKTAIQELELLTIPAQTHASGVITHTLKLTELGYYTIYLSGKNESNKEFSTKIPLKVGQIGKIILKSRFGIPKERMNEIFIQIFLYCSVR